MGKKNLLTGVETAGQGAGIGHMDPDAAAVRQLHPGQEPLPALQESGRNQGRRKTHRCRWKLWVWAVINFMETGKVRFMRAADGGTIY
jgi:hypothetical protein